MRIDFTCKRGEGAEPLNKGKAVSPEGRRVKSRWMDNDRMRDAERWRHD